MAQHEYMSFARWFVSRQEAGKTLRSGIQHAVSHTLHTALLDIVVNGGKD